MAVLTAALDVVDRLPNGAAVVFSDVTWDEFERFLDDLGDRAGLRISYDEGRLEVMSPSFDHEKAKEFFSRVVIMVADLHGISVESFGSATWKRPRVRKAVEPDCCFYIGDVSRVLGKRTIDLDTDPPPDIFVEIDITTRSLKRFPLFAALGIPELWRYDGQSAQFYELAGDTYHAVGASRFLPGMTPALVAEAIDQSKKVGHSAAVAALRRRLQETR